MKLSQLVPAVRSEVEKPFTEKLARAETLVRLWTKRRCVVSCSWGKDSMAVLWMALKVKPDIPVLFNNTGVEWAETIEFKQQVTEELKLNLIETHPEETYWQVLDRIIAKGYRLDDGRKHSNICCNALKHKPSRQALRAHQIEVSFDGITAVENRNRMFVACAKGMMYYTKKLGVTTVHPIMYWTPEEVWAYTRKEAIPVNPAYEKHHLERLGCMPCTSWKDWRKVLARENPRIYKFLQERYFRQKVLA